MFFEGMYEIQSLLLFTWIDSFVGAQVKISTTKESRFFWQTKRKSLNLSVNSSCCFEIDTLSRSSCRFQDQLIIVWSFTLSQGTCDQGLYCSALLTVMMISATVDSSLSHLFLRSVSFLSIIDRLSWTTSWLQKTEASRNQVLSISADE